jgi:hypothetical protein
MDVYLEIGKKRTFAGAIDWPGWCRSGRDEEAALQALVDYGPRYARVLHSTQLGFHAPPDTLAFAAVERLEGNATTDFGAPSRIPSSDTRPVDDGELGRFQALLEACWHAFDAAVQAAIGKELRKGPRGGGRDVHGIIEHVLAANAGYLSLIGWKFKKDQAGQAAGSSSERSLDEQLRRTHQAVLDGLAAVARGELPVRGPRGGVRWPPRYFVRRVAWHVLDHTWEIEDRVI